MVAGRRTEDSVCRLQALYTGVYFMKSGGQELNVSDVLLLAADYGTGCVRCGTAVRTFCGRRLERLLELTGLTRRSEAGGFRALAGEFLRLRAAGHVSSVSDHTAPGQCHDCF